MASTVLQTARLTLTPVALADADEIEALVSERDIAATTVAIPHPYPKGGARDYIGNQLPRAARGEAAQFIMRRRDDNTLVGSIGLTIEKEHSRAELGYWIGLPFWGHGYCTEAAAAVLDHAFFALKLNRIYAHHMLVNPASGKVMQKIGMKHEATLRNHIEKWGQKRDVAMYGITRSEYHPTNVSQPREHST